MSELQLAAVSKQTIKKKPAAARVAPPTPFERGITSVPV